MEKLIKQIETSGATFDQIAYALNVSPRNLRYRIHSNDTHPELRRRAEKLLNVIQIFHKENILYCWKYLDMKFKDIKGDEKSIVLLFRSKMSIGTLVSKAMKVAKDNIKNPQTWSSYLDE